MRPWHDRLQPTHLADVLLAAEMVDHDAGRHEEQRLEEGVRHQVEDRVAVGSDPGREEHVADLRHRRVRDHALDVPLHERDDTGHEQRDRAEDRSEVLHIGCCLEDRTRADQEVDARRHHRRGVDERGDRSRALHRVGKPGVKRNLGGLRYCAAEQPQRDEVHGRRRQRVDVFEHAQVLQGARLPDEQHEAERERRVADRVHHECLLGGGDRFRLVVPEPDQQIRRETDEAPADEQEQEVPRLHEQQHREDEERHVREEATLFVVALHVAHRVPDDEPADAGDDEHHRAGERVEQDLHLDPEVARLEPGVGGRDDLAVAVSLGPEPEEGDERASERDERRQRRDPRRRLARDPRPGERDRQRPGERRKEADPGAGDHPVIRGARSPGRRRGACRVAPSRR